MKTEFWGLGVAVGGCCTTQLWDLTDLTLQTVTNACVLRRLPEGAEGGGSPAQIMVRALQAFSPHFFLCEVCRRHFNKVCRCGGS